MCIYKIFKMRIVEMHNRKISMLLFLTIILSFLENNLDVGRIVSHMSLPIRFVDTVPELSVLGEEPYLIKDRWFICL